MFITLFWSCWSLTPTFWAIAQSLTICYHISTVFSSLSLSLPKKIWSELGASFFDFGDNIINLANLEVNKPLSFNLIILGNIHKKLQDLHEKQAKLDIESLATTVDEYIRVVGSIKVFLSTLIPTLLPFFENSPFPNVTNLILDWHSPFLFFLEKSLAGNGFSIQSLCHLSNYGTIHLEKKGCSP